MRRSLAEGFGFDLADALAADAELFADLAEGALVAAVQAEAQPQHLPLARVQLVERRLEPLRQIRRLGRLARRLGGGVVADQVTARQLAVFAQRRLERQRHARGAPRLVDPLGIDVEELRDLVDRRLATELGRQLALGARRLGQELGDVDGQPDGAALVGDRRA